MCTSTASKPARSNAAAISTWPFTPCSRRMATRGRAPVDERQRRSSASNVKLTRTSPGSSASRMRSYSSLRALRVVAQRLHALAWSRTRRAAGRSRFAANTGAVVARDADLVARVELADDVRMQSPRPAARSAAITLRAVGGADLQHRAELLGEQRLQREVACARPASCSSASRLKASTSSAAASKASASRLSVTPQRPANAISHSVANRPPSERS